MPRRAPAARTGVAAALLLAASLTAMALAASAPTVGSLSSAKLKERIVVNAQGHTLYWLSPETAHHLLCKTRKCLEFWPPLTVGSASAKLTAGPGVHGSLGILHRDGFYQVTLRGEPLYRYVADHAKGQVNGQGVHSFGGTWYAVTAAADPKPRRQASGSGEPAAWESPGGSSGSPSASGAYETPGSSGSSGTSTSGTPSSTPTSTAPKEEKAAPKEEKAPPKEETQAEKEAREKREREAREKREKEEKEYNEKYPGW